MKKSLFTLQCALLAASLPLFADGGDDLTTPPTSGKGALYEASATEAALAPALPVSEEMLSVKERAKEPTILSGEPIVEGSQKETSAAVPSFSACRFEPFTGVISGSKVRLRAHPSLDGHVVRETYEGELFLIVDEKSGYYAVIPPASTKGYVFRTFILDGTVEGERVNVRLYPDMEAPVIAQLNRGDAVKASNCTANSKWLEIELPVGCHFYIAKEYVQNRGAHTLFAEMQQQEEEALQQLHSTALFAQNEIQRPFEQINFERIQSELEAVKEDHKAHPSIGARAEKILALLQDIYLERKLAFLNNKSEASNHYRLAPEHVDQLTQLGIPLSSTEDSSAMAASSKAILAKDPMTDKMLAWLPFEEALYELWTSSHTGEDKDAFYGEALENAFSLTGIVESYDRPVKNRPGDFLLRHEGVPLAFLYSTQVNLQKWVGQNVTLLAAPRPNNQFAFPAYFVIAVE